MTVPTMTDEMKTLQTTTFPITQVRNDFPILATILPNGCPLVYLDNGATAQKPKCVIDKEVEVYEEYNANAHRGDYVFGVRLDEELEASRTLIANFIGANEPAEVVFTAGSTMSLNMVAHSWGRKFLKQGDEIVLNPMEHHANIVPWQLIAAETGAVLKYVPLAVDGTFDLASYREILSQKTRLVAVTGMSNVLGTVTPLEEIATAAKTVDALVVVDGAQLVPHAPVDVQKLGIDFLAFSGHKIYGPTGVGVLWGRRELLEAMSPFLAGGHMIDRVFDDHSTWAALPAKFEAGTLPTAQAIALGSAVEYVNKLGFPAIHRHEEELLHYAHERLNAIDGVKIHGPAVEKKGSIVSFTLKDAHPQDVANLLDRKGVAVRYGHHCTMLLHEALGVSATVRASFALYNTKEEIDVLADAIEFVKQRLRIA